MSERRSGSTLRQEPTIKTSPPPLDDAPIASNTGYIVGIIILVVIVIIMIVVILIFILSVTRAKSNKCTTNADCSGGRVCTAGVCSGCTAVPSIPGNVTITTNTGSATLSWTASPSAVSYNIYQKLEDPSVGIHNYDRISNTTSTTITITGLTTGTYYYVVTAVNACGQSFVSTPVVLASFCGALPATMAAPTITETANNCGTSTHVETISVSFTNTNIPNGVYVVRGTGQAGSVGSYLYLVQGNSFGLATGISQVCGAMSTSHTVTQITQVQNAEITNTGGPFTTGNSFTLTWDPVAGSEQYVAFLVGVNPVSFVAHFYGGYAPANSTSLQIPTTSGDNLVFALVLGFRNCDISSPSAPSIHVTPT